MKERPILFNAPMVRALLDGRKTQTRRIVDLDNLSGILHRQCRGDSIFSHIVAKPGKHKLWANRNFAISADMGETKLGLRPGEFNFLSPFAGECTAKTDNVRWTLRPIEPCRLWVRETWVHYQTVNMRRRGDGGSHDEISDGTAGYCADGYGSIEDFRKHIRLMGESDLVDVIINGDCWRPSIHMPRWASRITLEITGVRIERLQDISEEDAKAEGLIGPHHLSAEWTGCDGRWFHRPQDAFRSLWDNIYGSNQTKCWEANPWVWVNEFKRV